jgi:tetratricopeptide (TPR) repeat protein
MAIVQSTSGKGDAVASYRAALAIQQQLADTNPTAIEFQIDLAGIYINLGGGLYRIGKTAEALKLFDARWVVFKKLADAHPANAAFQRQLGIAYRVRGWHLAASGKAAEALASYRASHAILKKLADANPAVAYLQSQLQWSHYLLGQRLEMMGRPAEALASYEAAREIAQKLADANADVARYHQYQAFFHNSIGVLLHRTGKLAEALASHQAARAILKKLVAADPEEPVYRADLAYCNTLLADVHRSQGRRGEARIGYQDAIDMAREFSRDHALRDNATSRNPQAVLAYSLRRRGLTKQDEGDVVGAASDTQRAMQLLDGVPERLAWEWFETACCHATLSALAGREGSGVLVADGPAEATAALAVLKKAVGMCYRDPKAFRTETALDQLRERDDFQKLLAEIIALNKADAAIHDAVSR